MGEDAQAREELIRNTERRSSVRVRSLLPCALRPVDEADVAAIESRILDLAVLESDTAFDEESMWDQRDDDLRREVVLLLNEIRALRQKVSQLERNVGGGHWEELEERWVTINDRGFWFTAGEGVEYGVDDLIEVRMRLPSMQTQRILAIGKVIRVDEPGAGRDPGDLGGQGGDDEPGPGVAVEFRSISEIHQKAIMRYALLRERQVARSERLADLD